MNKTTWKTRASLIFCPLLEEVFSEERVRVWTDQGFAKQINGYDSVGGEIEMSFLTESGLSLVLSLAYS